MAESAKRIGVSTHTQYLHAYIRARFLDQILFLDQVDNHFLNEADQTASPTNSLKTISNVNVPGIEHRIYDH